MDEPVKNIRGLDLRCFSLASGKQCRRAAEAVIATVDHSDIRGSEPHNRDPSGAALD